MTKFSSLMILLALTGFGLADALAKNPSRIVAVTTRGFSLDSTFNSSMCWRRS